jgi:hypothetical protein
VIEVPRPAGTAADRLDGLDRVNEVANVEAFRDAVWIVIGSVFGLSVNRFVDGARRCV